MTTCSLLLFRLIYEQAQAIRSQKQLKRTSSANQLKQKSNVCRVVAQHLQI